MRFYLLDRILEMNLRKSAKGVKCWSLDNPIFQDHFPGFPVVPGVLLTESMAQLAGRLLAESYSVDYPAVKKVYPVLSIIQKAKFKNFVRPGDQCIITAELISLDQSRGNVNVSSTVDGELVCSATLSFIIGMEHDMKGNPFIGQLDEFFHNIRPDQEKK